jgi:hypothetical protein
VHVVLAVLRQVVVDDVGDARDVQAARADIRGDEDRSLPAWKLASTFWRLFCGTSPEITSAGRPLASRKSRTRSASRLVLTNTMVRVASFSRSRPMSSGSFSLFAGK